MNHERPWNIHAAGFEHAVETFDKQRTSFDDFVSEVCSQRVLKNAEFDQGVAHATFALQQIKDAKKQITDRQVAKHLALVASICRVCNLRHDQPTSNTRHHDIEFRCNTLRETAQNTSVSRGWMSSKTDWVKKPNAEQLPMDVARFGQLQHAFSGVGLYESTFPKLATEYRNHVHFTINPVFYEEEAEAKRQQKHVLTPVADDRYAVVCCDICGEKITLHNRPTAFHPSTMQFYDADSTCDEPPSYDADCYLFKNAMFALEPPFSVRHNTCNDQHTRLQQHKKLKTH